MDNRPVYHLVYKSKKRNTAGSKAPRDITQICNDLGFHEIVMPVIPAQRNKLYIKLWLLTTGVWAWRNICRKIPKGSALIYQHPTYGIRLTYRYINKLQKKKNCRCIALIHDLESLRKGIAGVVESNDRRNEIGDNLLLKRFDAVICHNDSMKEYLVRQGVDAEKLVTLEIFDYLTDATPVQHNRKEGMPSIAVAGNLAAGKSTYIYKMTEEQHNPNLQIHLFGINYDEEKKLPNTVYHGSYTPEELVGALDADFGLVWDGPEAKYCTGNTGEYLRYNNPHKTSLYLAAGIPVVVWKEAAIARFVEKNGVGITVESLYEVENAIQRVNRQDYELMHENAGRIAAKLRDGAYFKSAVSKALSIVE